MTKTDETTLTKPVENLYAQIGGRSASLIVLTGSELGKMFRLEKPELVIGRATDADIHLEDEGISRHHAKVVRTETEIRLIELGSKNGIWCNGERVVDARVLVDGDKIQVGSDVILKLSFQDKLDEAALQSLYNASARDGLTGAFNKKFLTEALNKEFAYCARHDLMLSVVMIDIDHFKAINDTYGHAAGDHALVNLVANLHQAIRTEDILARVGGEEFALLLREIPADVSLAVAERLRRRVEGMDLEFNGSKLKLTISAGVATYVAKNFATADEFLSDADGYLYRAKDQGRNRVRSRWLLGV